MVHALWMEWFLHFYHSVRNPWASSMLDEKKQHLLQHHLHQLELMSLFVLLLVDPSVSVHHVVLFVAMGIERTDAYAVVRLVVVEVFVNETAIEPLIALE